MSFSPPYPGDNASPLPSPRLSKPASLPTAKSTSDPILRNALRYTVSPREYAALHKYVLSRSKVLRKKAPSVAAVQAHATAGPVVAGGGAGAAGEAGTGGTTGALNASIGDDFNARAVRHALRVFAAGVLGMKGWELISRKILKREPEVSSPSIRQSNTVRLPLSLSLILLLYRLLFRFLTRLRAHLLAPTSTPFRNRNPKTAAALTSPYAPATGAALAGAFLSVAPRGGMRVGVALWMAVRALEWGWDQLEGEGKIWGWRSTNGGGSLVKRERPWWFGSWVLQPFVFGQLLHAVVFDRDCFPMEFGKFIFGTSSTYLHPRPPNYPIHLKWPRTYQVVDDLAAMARLSWPTYISPTLFPSKLPSQTVPSAIKHVTPLTATAHPLIMSLSCAALHPSDPSCLRTYLTFWLRSFPPITRFFVLAYTVTTFLPALSKLYHAPFSTLRKVLTRALNSATFATGAISTAWASICLFQAWLPRRILATQRFFLGGFLAGLWAWVERKRGRALFLYSFKASLESLWRVGVKRRWWKGVQGGDVGVFIVALMVSGWVYERGGGKGWRRGVSWVRGTGWRDWGIEEDDQEEEDEEEETDEALMGPVL